uniref:Reverse transcriptase domain-containing protein n=1 Tax=Haemonchus contortus TaxID=6289 RepID=A0A7I4YCH1_HAECO
MGGPLKTILLAIDIALLAESKEELQDKLQKLQKVLADDGLRLNVKKTSQLNRGVEQKCLIELANDSFHE